VSERIRTALDLPTKEDLVTLSTRLDQLDARLAELAAARGIAVETTPDSSIPTRSKIVADKRSRKAKS
jgi:hypothetical protein